MGINDPSDTTANLQIGPAFRFPCRVSKRRPRQAEGQC